MKKLSINVLYVDDDQQNLVSFRAAFRSAYKIFTANSVVDAFEILKSENINVLLSDQRMPEITGVEFLRQAKDSYPDIPRILVTGYTDITVLTEAINKGDIYRYITKPWDVLEIQNAIINAYDQYLSRITLKEKIRELEYTNDGLNRFIYSISHELRAPIASALGIIDLGKPDVEHTTVKEYWDLLEVCIKKLDYYVTQTVGFYKTARVNITGEAINFEQMVHSLLSIYKAQQGVQEVRFEVTVDQQAPFWGDAFRVEIILANLLSNAIKFQRDDAAEKQVKITISVTAVEVMITIADNGQGIAQENIQMVFDQFFKGGNDEGLGLGLYILKEAVNKLGGTVTVESEVGQYTTFNVRLPNASEDKQ